MDTLIIFMFFILLLVKIESIYKGYKKGEYKKGRKISIDIVFIVISFLILLGVRFLISTK